MFGIQYLLTQCNTFGSLEMQDKYVNEESRNNDNGPLIMNAFEMITLSQGLNLSALFDRRQVHEYDYDDGWTYCVT